MTSEKVIYCKTGCFDSSEIDWLYWSMRIGCWYNMLLLSVFYGYGKWISFQVDVSGLGQNIDHMKTIVKIVVRSHSTSNHVIME